MTTRLYLVCVQEVRWNKEGIVRAEDYIFFFYGKENKNHHSGTCYFAQHRRGSAVKRVRSVYDRMTTYIVQ
jgi:hypothetical protein